MFINTLKLGLVATVKIIRFLAGMQQLCETYRISKGGALVMLQAYESDEPLNLQELVVGPRKCWTHALGRNADLSLCRFIEVSSGRRPFVLMTLNAKGRRALDRLCANLK